MHSHKRD